MHGPSYEYVGALLHAHCRGDGTELVLDVGARDVNGSYRTLFTETEDGEGIHVKAFIGVDIEAGDGVDVVMADPYRVPLSDGTFDVVLSGNTMEHVKFFWVWALELARVLKPGGILILAVPRRCGLHRHPVDCWRFQEDGIRCLLGDWMKLDMLDCFIKVNGNNVNGNTEDVYGVARKPLDWEMPKWR